jgi:hypothetical protein
VPVCCVHIFSHKHFLLLVKCPAMFCALPNEAGKSVTIL